jgi:hypothetical protein
MDQSFNHELVGGRELKAIVISSISAFRSFDDDTGVLTDARYIGYRRSMTIDHWLSRDEQSVPMFSQILEVFE